MHTCCTQPRIYRQLPGAAVLLTASRLQRTGPEESWEATTQASAARTLWAVSQE